MSIILVQPRFEHSLTLFGRAAITASLSCRLSSFAVAFASSMLMACSLTLSSFTIS